MKNKILIFLSVTVVLLVACTNNEPIESAINDTVKQQVYNLNRRSYTEAVEIAQNSIKILQEDETSTRNLPASKPFAKPIHALQQHLLKTTH